MTLKEEGNAACIPLRAKKEIPDRKYLSYLCSSKVTLIIKYVYLLSILNVACHNYNYHSGISMVVPKIFLISIITFKSTQIYYYLLKQIPVIFSLISISILYSLSARKKGHV